MDVKGEIKSHLLVCMGCIHFFYRYPIYCKYQNLNHKMFRRNVLLLQYRVVLLLIC